MSSSEAACRSADGVAGSREDHPQYAAARKLAASLGAAVASGQAGAFPDDVMRDLMAALVNIYAAKFDEGQRPALIDPAGGVSATAILMTTSALMKSSNLEIFELGMWQSWSGTR
jgi:hypothetical protein